MNVILGLDPRISRMSGNLPEVLGSSPRMTDMRDMLLATFERRSGPTRPALSRFVLLAIPPLAA